MGQVVLHPAMKPQRSFFEPPPLRIIGPDGVSEIDVVISPTTIAEYAKSNRRVPLFQAWAHLVGEMPPVNNAYHYPQNCFPERGYSFN